MPFDRIAHSLRCDDKKLHPTQLGAKASDWNLFQGRNEARVYSWGDRCPSVDDFERIEAEHGRSWAKSWHVWGWTAQRKAENRDQDKPKRFMFDDPLKEYAAEMLQKKKESWVDQPKENSNGKVPGEWWIAVTLGLGLQTRWQTKGKEIQETLYSSETWAQTP